MFVTFTMKQYPPFLSVYIIHETTICVIMLYIL